jgi:hypothetical protein
VTCTVYVLELPKKDDTPVRAEAFVLYIIGTLSMKAGLFLCSYLVDTFTSETSWKLKHKARMLWLQCAGNVGDHHVDSHALLAASYTDTAKTSRKRWEEDRTPKYVSRRVGLGSILAIVGYVLQFISFRMLHWLAPLAHLCGIFIMIIGRSWKFNNCATLPHRKDVRAGFETEWLAEAVASGKLISGFEDNDNVGARQSIPRKIDTDLVKIRKFLGGVISRKSRVSSEAAALSKAIEEAMSGLWTAARPDDGAFANEITWTWVANFRGESSLTCHPITFRIKKVEEKWEVPK